MPPKIAEISRTMAINATKDAKIIIVLNYFKLNNKFLPADGNRLTQKKKRGYRLTQIRDDQVPVQE